jgi:hypothetical protein
MSIQEDIINDREENDVYSLTGELDPHADRKKKVKINHQILKKETEIN